MGRDADADVAQGRWLALHDRPAPQVGLNMGIPNCPVPCDYLPKRSYPLFRAREVLEYLALGGAGGSPEGDQRLPPGPAPRRG